MNTYKFITSDGNWIILEGIILQEVIDKLNELNIESHNDYILFLEKKDAVDIQLNEEEKKNLLNSKKTVNTWTDKV